MARWRASSLPLLAFAPLVLLHLYIAPYTKVEESFNIQATHDILKHGVPISGNAYVKFKTFYDHMTFPGAVPRTFVGAMTLAAVAKPVVWISGNADGEHQQLIGESAIYRWYWNPHLLMIAAQCAASWDCSMPRRSSATRLVSVERTATRRQFGTSCFKPVNFTSGTTHLELSQTCSLLGSQHSLSLYCSL